MNTPPIRYSDDPKAYIRKYMNNRYTKKRSKKNVPVGKIQLSKITKTT